MLEIDPTLTLPFIFSVATALYAYIRTRRGNVDERFGDMSDRIDEAEKQIATLDLTVAAMPGREDIHKMEITLVEMSGQMGVIEAHMAGQKDVLKRLETVVGRQEDHLLTGGSK